MEAQARRSPDDGRLLALLGARLADSENYAVAAQTLERAVAAGADDASVWLSWSASCAAAGDNVKAGAVLRLGLRQADAAPAIRAALERVRKLGDRPSPGALAEAISPQGLDRLLAVYGGGSVLNGLAMAGAASPRRERLCNARR